MINIWGCRMPKKRDADENYGKAVNMTVMKMTLLTQFQVLTHNPNLLLTTQIHQNHQKII